MLFSQAEELCSDFISPIILLYNVRQKATNAPLRKDRHSPDSTQGRSQPLRDVRSTQDLHSSQ